MSAEGSPAGEPDSGTDATDKCLSCPTCGKEFETNQGMKCHHAKIHNESLAHTVNCDWCEKEFQRRKSVAEDNDHNFCGDNCRGKWLSENNTGEDSHCWVGYETSSCKYCGDDFQHRPFLDKVYCGKGCRNKYNKQNGKQSNFYKGGKVTVECRNCKQSIEVYPSKSDSKKYCSKECMQNNVELECEWCGDKFTEVKSKAERRRCCSKDCWAQLRSTFPSEQQPNYRGGHDGYDYGENWYAQRRKARKRDHYSCQVCGRDERQLGKMPSCHHIIKLKKFRRKYSAPEWYERGNEIGNLILLCEKHHKQWEGIPLRPQ